MQSIRIKCPKCQVALNVSNINNEAERLIVCPQCHAQLRIKFAPQQTPAQDAGPVADEGETVIGTSRRATAIYALKCDGEIYPLKDGQNGIGRKASTSKASIQIDTPDQKMSRHHAHILLNRLPNGVVKIKISNWQNKNATFVNNIQVSDGEVLFIEEGDIIKIGATHLQVICI